MNGKPWCSIEELREYLNSIEQPELLNNLDFTGSRIVLSATYRYDYAPSIKRQVASVLAVLGEYELANSVHKITWGDLSPAGEKVSLQIIQRFGNFEKHAV